MISRRIWRVGNRLCVCLLRLILSTCLTATLAPFLYIAIPLLSIFEHFALQILLLCVICGVAALFYRKWISVGLAATVAVWSLFGAASTLMSSTEDQNSRATASENIKLLSLNMWERNTAYGQTLQYLEESHADVIGLVEVTPTWAVALHALDKRYPFRIDCPQSLPNSGLRNAPGLALTWPSWNEALLRLPIDQIFSRGNITMSDFSAAPATGSDHLPIIATLTIKP